MFSGHIRRCSGLNPWLCLRIIPGRAGGGVGGRPYAGPNMCATQAPSQRNYLFAPSRILIRDTIAQGSEVTCPTSSQVSSDPVRSLVLSPSQPHSPWSLKGTWGAAPATLDPAPRWGETRGKRPVQLWLHQGATRTDRKRSNGTPGTRARPRLHQARERPAEAKGSGRKSGRVRPPPSSRWRRGQRGGQRAGGPARG